MIGVDLTAQVLELWQMQSTFSFVFKQVIGGTVSRAMELTGGADTQAILSARLYCQCCFDLGSRHGWLGGTCVLLLSQ